jgi:rod shape-determining protein MreD
MRWATFIGAALVAIVADASLMGALEVGGIAPRLTVVLVTFVALNADALTASWAAVLCGALIDLSDPSMTGPRSPHFLLGPHALGLLFGVQGLVALRGSVVRRNPLALGAMTALLAVADGLVWVAIWTVRSWYPDSPPPWGESSSLGQVGRQVLQALSTGIVAIPVGWLLARTMPAWGFPSVLSRSRTQGGSARITRQ